MQNKEEQKQHLIDMMRGDEELGLYDESKKETTLEEAAEKYSNKIMDDGESYHGFKAGAKWEAKRRYSEEDMKEAFRAGRMVKNYKAEWEETYSDEMTSCKYADFKEWFEQFKKK